MSVEPAHAHVDRPDARIVDDADAFELVRKLPKCCPLRHIEDDFLIAISRPTRVRVDYEEPAQHEERPEHRNERNEAQQSRDPRPAITRDFYPLLGPVHVPPVLASKNP